MPDTVTAPTITPGLYDLPASSYHADPCPEPSLSASLITIMCRESLWHAQQAHPKLTPSPNHEDAEHLDVGTAAHALLLEGKDNVVLIDAPDWRTQAARTQRDTARAEGKVPLLRRVWTDVSVMVGAARQQLAVHADTDGEMFRAGEPEKTLIWQEDGVWCRARLDWLRPLIGARPGLAVDDYKTTKGSANPDVWGKTIFEHGFDVQAMWYRRGLKHLTGVDATFRFCVQETYPPYALSVIALGPEAETLAEKKILWALDHWHAALVADEFTGYPRRTCYVGLPPWEENWWLTKELR